MASLFATKAPENRRSVRLPILLTPKEREQIGTAASIRQLDVSDFVRRAALGRRADVRYETEIVLQLMDVVRAIRAVHKATVDRNLAPPVEAWSMIMDHAIAAISRISK